MINFAHDGLVTIDCDCLQFDGHNVQNLVSTNKYKRAKGFLADRFIKPPASISLLFKCDVDITKVVLKPRVGSQKSAGFEMFKVYKNKSTLSIAQTVIKDGSEVLLFCRSDDPVTSGAVRFCSDRAVNRVREIKLKIFKTSGSTVPALGGLDVWGKPSSNVPDVIRREVISIWQRICHPVENPAAEKGTPLESPAPARNPALKSDVVVPDEFVDPISCEIMTIPMTLPSGNNVDLSTLEKFQAAQAKLGRPPCDPFTGVVFSENLKPVVATSLKSRLDKFLLENSEAPAVKTLPRTLGRKSSASSSSSRHQTSSYSGPCKRISDASERANIQTVDDLLLDCLSGLPSFLDDCAPKTKKLRTDCAKCAKPASPGKNEYFFRLPCQDILCRECLCSMKALKENECKQCSEPFDFSSVVRHYI